MLAQGFPKLGALLHGELPLPCVCIIALLQHVAQVCTALGVIGLGT
ncbi:MAG: hypothetical protein H7332_04850 [Bdellovibrionales bacterium]|nr:hypothetical protein [Ramlibacter sp.]